MKKASRQIMKFPLVITLKLLLGIGASLLSLYLFLNLTVNINSIHELDVFFSILMYELRTPALNAVMLFITLLGNEILLILLITVFLFAALKKHKREALMIVVIFIIGVLINLLLKDLIARDRPVISPLLDERFYSFPSGHAMNAFVFYATLVIYVYRASRSWFLTCISLVINGTIIILVGVSRVYLGVHYLTDIIAGYIAGFWWITTALVVENSFKLLFRNKKKAT